MSYELPIDIVNIQLNGNRNLFCSTILWTPAMAMEQEKSPCLE